MPSHEALLGALALAASISLIGIGSYGLAASRSLVRQLLSIEVIFNSILLLAVVILSSAPAVGVLVLIVIITVVTGEIVVVVAILMALYRGAGGLDSRVLEEEGV